MEVMIPISMVTGRVPSNMKRNSFEWGFIMLAVLTERYAMYVPIAVVSSVL